MRAEVQAPVEPVSDRHLVVLWSLLVVAVAVRVWAVPQARFTGDESLFWAIARKTATFRELPSFGPALTGSPAHHPGPLFYYLMAVPQRLGASPWFGGVFVALLHATAGGILFDLVRRFFSVRAGLWAIALFAFAPWDVLYADRIWLSNVAPIWGLLLFYSAMRARAPGPWQGALVFFALTCPQLHMSAPIAWVAAAVWLALRPPAAWSKRALGLGVLIAVIAYAPAIVSELSTGFANTRAILERGGGHQTLGSALRMPARAFGYAILFSTSEIGYQFARGYWENFQDHSYYFTASGLRSYWALHRGWAVLNAFSVLIAYSAWVRWGWHLAGALRGGVRHIRQWSAELHLVLSLVAGLLAAGGLLFASRKGFFPHYVNLFMPLALVPLALLLDALARRGRRALWMSAGATALIALAMASSTYRYYRYIDRLNGLETTMSLTAEVLESPMPVRVRFAGFDNRFAWHQLAQTYYEKPLSFGFAGSAWFVVHNDKVFVGELPQGSTLHGGAVRMEARRF